MVTFAFSCCRSFQAVRSEKQLLQVTPPCGRSIRWCTDYDENGNDSNGTVTFCHSHFTLCSWDIITSLPCGKCCWDNGCHSDGDSHGRKGQVGKVKVHDGASKATILYSTG